MGVIMAFDAVYCVITLFVIQLQGTVSLGIDILDETGGRGYVGMVNESGCGQ